MNILEKIMSYKIVPRDFVDRRKIIPILGLEPSSKLMLLNETLTQRTYLIKGDVEFFIVNDNRGKLKIALRRSIEFYKRYNISMNNSCYLMTLIGLKPSVKVSKFLFSNMDDLIDKINSL